MEKPDTIGNRERAWQKRQKTLRDMERRTRRSASTIGGAAPDTIIGRAAADCAGARPYRATRCENVSKWAMPVPTYRRWNSFHLAGSWSVENVRRIRNDRSTDHIAQRLRMILGILNS